MFHYLNLIGEDKDATLDAYDRQQANFDDCSTRMKHGSPVSFALPSRRGTRNSPDIFRNSSLATGNSGGSTTRALPIF